MKLRLAPLCLWPALVFSGAAAAQGDAHDKGAVFRRVRDFVVSVALGNALAVDQELGDWMASYGAETRGGGLVILMTTRRDPEWTREEFEGEPASMRLQGYEDVVVPDVKVTGLGDDNHFIECRGDRGALLVFRKGVYHVRLYAETREAAEGAAWNVVTLIPAE